MAWGRIYANGGAMTPGVCGETADGMSLAKIGRIISALRCEHYRFSQCGGCTSRRKAVANCGRSDCRHGRTSSSAK